VVDLAEIVRGEGARFLSTHAVTQDQYKALVAIAGCQTEAMGAVLEKCQQCRTEYWLFRSCRNRS
jgi:G:T-mismatch repair DNA endonuclease (very short patch repair protein)